MSTTTTTQTVRPCISRFFTAPAAAALFPLNDLHLGKNIQIKATPEA